MASPPMQSMGGSRSGNETPWCDILALQGGSLGERGMQEIEESFPGLGRIKGESVGVNRESLQTAVPIRLLSREKGQEGELDSGRLRTRRSSETIPACPMAASGGWGPLELGQLCRVLPRGSDTSWPVYCCVHQSRHSGCPGNGRDLVGADPSWALSLWRVLAGQGCLHI